MRTRLARAITADEICAYHQAGVVLLKSVLDLATVNLLRACIDDGVKSIGASPTGCDLTKLRAAQKMAAQEVAGNETAGNDDDGRLRPRDGGQHDVSTMSATRRQSGKPPLDGAENTRGSFYFDTALSTWHDAFRRLILRGSFVDIAAALLGSVQVRFYQDQLFFKEPQSNQRTAFHQDATHCNIEGDDCCTLWAPVDPVTLENGALQYVRGSHRDGRYYAPNVLASQTRLAGQTLLAGATEEPVPDIEGHPEAYDIVHFDTEPGDVLVHHYRMLHGAGGNLSPYQPLRAASMRYTGDDIRFKTRAGAPRQPGLKSQLADGNALTDIDFPVVWRRPREARAA